MPTTSPVTLNLSDQETLSQVNIIKTYATQVDDQLDSLDTIYSTNNDVEARILMLTDTATHQDRIISLTIRFLLYIMIVLVLLLGYAKFRTKFGAWFRTVTYLGLIGLTIWIIIEYYRLKSDNSYQESAIMTKDVLNSLNKAILFKSTETVLPGDTIGATTASSPLTTSGALSTTYIDPLNNGSGKIILLDMSTDGGMNRWLDGISAEPTSIFNSAEKNVYSSPQQFFGSISKDGNLFYNCSHITTSTGTPTKAGLNMPSTFLSNINCKYFPGYMINTTKGVDGSGMQIALSDSTSSNGYTLVDV